MWFELFTARYPGMRRWLTQRLCALTMAIYMLLFLLRVCWLSPSDFSGWQALFMPWWWRVLTGWFFICMLLHAWLGVRDVLRDYVPHLTLRAMLQWLVDITVIGNLLAAGLILFGLNF
ncbi:succinate dehydrogenase, hydrophobic membrane anchor protein [Methylophilus aquaticus]|uniref:Succinate dehydrogenase hydrophobic membrane anchor subunit n=1 Tax=Methylophilus aquaticus TaxID=1971610 RepID=A0ABT9JUK7_9PROT|nr:succinate dehydrogenase, hydrophobic membrane anchor protein [Methylophilus aquaticus]MDP8568169.1 succinate dehydrogenase, hydrophobic membrane anchor protein [Methylophilus aquaticus]